MPRLPPAPQPAQAIACGSAFRRSVHEAGRRPLLMGTTTCSAETVLDLYPTLNLPHYSAVGWHACNHEKRGPCTVWHQHTRSTSDVQQHRADDAPDGTGGVLTGTRRVLGCWIEYVQADETQTMHRAA